METILFWKLECGNYSRAETNQERKLLIIRRFCPRKLFKGGNYSQKYGMSDFSVKIKMVKVGKNAKENYCRNSAIFYYLNIEKTIIVINIIRKNTLNRSKKYLTHVSRIVPSDHSWYIKTKLSKKENFIPSLKSSL